jgi:uncharacterized protein YbbK (DUF523 family)
LIVVSACMAGKPCRYDGKSKPMEAVAELVRQGEAVVVCPECLGGLPIPRPPSEIVGGDGADVLCGRARVIAQDGRDVTEAYVLGAQRTVAFCRKHGATAVWLKAKSPSCGVGRIYDGTFTRTLRPGDGVAVAALKAAGIPVKCQDEDRETP